MCLFLLACCGCAGIEPFRPLANEAPIAERKAAYEKHCVLRKSLVFPFNEYLETNAVKPWWALNYFRLGTYYRDSGDPASAQLMDRWFYWNLAGTALLVPGAVLLVNGDIKVFSVDRSKPDNETLNQGMGLVFIGTGVGLLGCAAVVYGYYKYLFPAADSFNGYLRRRLELSMVPAPSSSRFQVSLKF